MLPSLQHLSLAVGAPSSDDPAPRTHRMDSRSIRKNRMEARRPGGSSLLQERRPRPARRTLPEAQRWVPVAPAAMRATVNEYVIEPFLKKWRAEAQHGLLHHWKNYVSPFFIPTTEEDGWPRPDDEAFAALEQCDVFCEGFMDGDFAAVFVVGTLHHPRNFFDALSEVMRHAHYYQTTRQRAGTIMGIIALDRKPRAEEAAVANNYGVQCWWPSRSVADLIDPAGVEDKENQSPEESDDENAM